MKNSNLAPHENVREEQVVLGRLLQSESAYWSVAEVLKPEHFSRPIHQQIYGAIRSLLGEGGKLSLQVLTARMGEEYGEGQSTLTLLTALLRDAENGDLEGVEEIIDLWRRRKHIEELSRAMKEAQDPLKNITDLMSDHEVRFQDIGQNAQTQPARSMGQIVKKVLTYSEKAKNSQKSPGISTGLPSLDEIMGRIHAPDLGFILADPNIGKTILAQHLAQAAAAQGFTTGFFQLDMSGDDMGRRALSSSALMSTSTIEDGAFDFDQLERLKEAAAGYENLPLFVDDREELYIEQIRDRLLYWKRSKGLRLGVIDHLRKIKVAGNFKDQFERAAHVTGRLKTYCKQLDIALIVLVHRLMSEQRASDVPKIQDADGGGAVQRDADWVIGMRRPELRWEREKPEDHDTPEFRKWSDRMVQLRNLLEIYNLKGRRSATGTMRSFKFDGQHSRIYEYER